MHRGARQGHSQRLQHCVTGDLQVCTLCIEAAFEQEREATLALVLAEELERLPGGRHIRVVAVRDR